MDFITTPLPGLTLVQPRRFTDARGYFMETYNRAEFEAVTGPVDWLQDNESQSVRGVLRGLHMQLPPYSQAKLVRVSHGAVYDVAVDLRPDSPTRGRWFGTLLSAENATMMFIPRGFAHGFAVLSDVARFAYKVDNVYAPRAEITLRYNDPEVNINWHSVTGMDEFILSDKDTSRSLDLEQVYKLIR